jgi:subtilisin family serine protease
MTRRNYQPVLFFLAILLYLIPTLVTGAGYQEFLIRIADSLSTQIQQSSTANKQILVKNYLQLSENVIIKQIADIPNSKISSWYLLRLPDSDREQMKIVSKSNYLDYSQENHSFGVHISPPNDPLYLDQWYHSQVKSLESWERYVSNDDIILAIIDTGIDYTHPDLAGSLWINTTEDINENGILDSADINHLDDDGNGYVDDVIGWDFTDAPRFADGGDYLDPDNDPMDDYFGGHGTRIAGIIAAQTSNSLGIAALTPGARVMNLRAGTASGFLEEDDVARAVLYAINNDARIINMSFGDVVVSRFLKDVIEYAYSEGIIIVASSGNSGTNVTHFPSGMPQTISVGATDRSDQLAGFSNWGHTLDLVAPGVDILSPRAGGGYDMVNGTSFSAPMVTAAAGLLLSANPDYSTEQVRNLLKSSADDIGIRGWDQQTGSGRLNMNRTSQMTNKTSLLVNNPASESSVASDSIPLVVTAIDPDLISVNVSYGLGKDPLEWFNLVTDHPYQIVADTITSLITSTLPDTIVIIKLSLTTWRGEVVESHSLISIDRTKPVVNDITHLEALDGDVFISLIEFETDDITSADIFYRSVEGTDPFEAVHLKYETNHHYYASSFSADIEYYVRVVNKSGLVTIDDNNGQYFKIRNRSGPTIQEDFLQVSQTLPAGFMLEEASDFDKDGNFEVVLSVYDEFGSFGPVSIYEFSQGQFIKRSETPFKGIPRSFGDADNDGKQDLLIGFGQKSYLLEATEQDDWPSEIVWSDTGAFWASRISDLDKDGLNEIIGKEGSDFVLLETNGDNQFHQKYVFNNLSPGENLLGPPRSEVADLDGDGRLELYFGDYDGDLVIYESSGNDLFEAGRYVSLPHGDATNYFSSGRFLSTEQMNLVVGTHTGIQQLSEHQVDGLYWDFSILSSDQNNQHNFEQHLYIYGYANVRDFESGVNTGSIHTSQSDYLFLAPYPDLYLYKSEGDSLVPVWHKNNVNTNTILVHDFDQNGSSEFYINNGQEIIGFEPDGITRPQPPIGFDAYPIDTHLVRLQWNPVIGADRYIIYRGPDSENLSKFDSTSTHLSYLDSTVLENQHYYYALQTIDISFGRDQSKLSKILSAIPNNPPSIDTLLIKNDNQIEVYFSEPMDILSLNAINFHLRDEDNATTSAIAFLNGNAVLLSFSKLLIAGKGYSLEMNALRDTSKTPLPENESVQQFIFLFAENVKPYVQEWKFDSQQSLILKFNTPMNSSTVMDVSNYELEPSGTVEKVEAVDDEGQLYRIHLSHDTYGASTGVTTYLSFDNLSTQQGEILDEGDRIALVTAAKDIADILVYPQPITAEDGWLMFSNIAEGTAIRIFDVNGHLIVKLEELDQNGGVRWDLRDQSGNMVSSGIYIYYATFDNQTKLGKFTIIK